MFGFRICIRLTQKQLLSPPSLQQSLSLGINPSDTAEPCYPHDNIVGSHLCDECMKPILPNVCHMPSISRLLLQVCWPTTECLVFRFVPSTSISTQFVSNFFGDSPIDSSSSCLNRWSSKQGLELFLSAPLCCLPARNIVQHTFEHVLPYHRTTPPSLRETCPTLVTFHLLLQIYVIQTSVYIPQWSLHLVCIHVEYIPNIRGHQMMLVSSRSTLFINVFHMGAIFCFIPAIFDIIHINR